MNVYAIIILLTILIEFALNLVADILNLKNLSSELPQEFQGVYNEEDYKKSQEYTRVNTKFGYVTSVFGLALILGFWFSGGFNYVDRIVRSWNLNPIWTGLVYVGILIFFRSILSLSFSIYETFVIEERFGFNKTTVKTFVLDLVKVLFLSILLGGPLFAGILAFFEYTGAMAWFYCWVATSLFTIVIQFIAPIWIMPLFNKFKPLKNDELKESILSYATSVKYSLAGVFEIDGSRRSSKSNAFFTGFGKNKRIALYDTLIEKHTVPELVTILAHEIGHYKKKHIISEMIIGIIHTGFIFYLLSLFISNNGLFDAFYMQDTSIYAGMIFFGMLYSPIELILSIFMNIFSRKKEYEADRFAAKTTKQPEVFISALKKLSLSNLINLKPHPFYAFLNYSHPPILERIKELRSYII